MIFVHGKHLADLKEKGQHEMSAIKGCLLLYTDKDRQNRFFACLL